MSEGRDDDMSTELAALDELPVRDQWAEIVARARGEAEVVDLRSRRRMRPATRPGRLLGGVAAAAALVLVGLLVGRTTAPGRSAPVARPVAPPATWSLGPATAVPGLVGALPLVADADGVRVAAARGGDSVSVVDARGGIRTVPMDSGLTALAAGRAAGGGFVAVALTESGSLWSIDRAGVARVLVDLGPVPSGGGSVAIAGGRVFVAGSAAGPLVAVESSGGSEPVPTGAFEPTHLSGRGDDLWALDQASGRVALISARSRRVRGSVTVEGASQIAAGSNRLYVLRRSAGALTEVGPDLHARYLARVGELATGLTSTRRNVWVTGDGVLTAYAAGTGRFDGVLVLPVAGDVAATSDDRTTWSLSAATGLTRLVRDP